MVNFTIVEDTREQTPWAFSMIEECIGSVKIKLDEGDYTTKEILDLESATGRKILRIERKASTGEISLNLGKLYKRFLKEMERLQNYEHKYMIMEFSISDVLNFPEGSGIPEEYWYKKSKKTGKKISNLRMNGKMMYARLKDIESKYDVKLVFASNKADAEAAAIKVIEKVHNANFSQSR